MQSCEHIRVSSLVSHFASQSVGHFQVLILFLRTTPSKVGVPSAASLPGAAPEACRQEKVSLGQAERGKEAGVLVRGRSSSCVSWTVSLRKNLLLLCLGCRWHRKAGGEEPVQPGDSPPGNPPSVSPDSGLYHLMAPPSCRGRTGVDGLSLRG